MRSVDKMYLVPAEATQPQASELLHRIQLSQQPVEARAAAKLEDSMNNLLHGSEPSDVKVKLYAELLNRYRQMQDPQKEPMQPQQPQATATPFGDTEQLAQLLPVTQQRKGRSLLNFIENSGLSRWDADGSMLYDNGTPMRGSNVVDLLHYATLPPSRVPAARVPTGWDEFAARLMSRNVPRAVAPGVWTIPSLQSVPGPSRIPAPVTRSLTAAKRRHKPVIVSKRPRIAQLRAPKNKANFDAATSASSVPRTRGQHRAVGENENADWLGFNASD